MLDSITSFCTVDDIDTNGDVNLTPFDDRVSCGTGKLTVFLHPSPFRVFLLRLVDEGRFLAVHLPLIVLYSLSGPQNVPIYPYGVAETLFPGRYVYLYLWIVFHNIMWNPRRWIAFLRYFPLIIYQSCCWISCILW